MCVGWRYVRGVLMVKLHGKGWSACGLQTRVECVDDGIARGGVECVWNAGWCGLQIGVECVDGGITREGWSVCGLQTRAEC